MHQRAFLSGGWSRNGVIDSGVVRRAHPASGAQWNVQVVRGKVNSKCLWNACKALSLGLLLMVLGTAMATIGYYADHLSVAQEIRGNHTVKVKNESRGFHLNNLSYAGPIVMGVGGFIVVAACVMTFEARDSAAKVVPARFKMTANGASVQTTYAHSSFGGFSPQSSLKTPGAQSTAHQIPRCLRGPTQADRRTVTQSFMKFSKGLALDTHNRNCSLQYSQISLKKSPSAPDLPSTHGQGKSLPRSTCHFGKERYQTSLKSPGSSNVGRTTFATCALLNPSLLHRHALSVDETAGNYRFSHESLQASGSQGSMALDLHLECPVTLKVKDRRKNLLKRQSRVDEGDLEQDDILKKSSNSCSARLIPNYSRDFSTSHILAGGSANQLSIQPPYSYRRSSNASDYSYRIKKHRKHCHHKGRLERAVSSDSRLTGTMSKYDHNHTPTQMSTEQEPVGTSSDTDIRQSRAFLRINVSKN